MRCLISQKKCSQRFCPSSDAQCNISLSLFFRLPHLGKKREVVISRATTKRRSHHSFKKKSFSARAGSKEASPSSSSYRRRWRLPRKWQRRRRNLEVPSSHKQVRTLQGKKKQQKNEFRKNLLGSVKLVMQELKKSTFQSTSLVMSPMAGWR